jgi:ATP-dependent Clp protease, protease subunit
MTDFEKYAVSRGIGSATLDSYQKYVGKKNPITNSYISPVIIEERPMNVASMDVFSRLMYDRIIFYGCEVCAESANIVNAQLLYLNSIGDEDVKMFINSPGGSVDDGLSVIDTMNFITPDIQTYCMGLAASMGSILLTSGKKGKRYSLPHGKILIHQPIGGAQGQCSDIQIAAKEIEKCKAELYKILSETTGQSVEKITADADRDYWMTAQEALDYGIIDEIITQAK